MIKIPAKEVVDLTRVVINLPFPTMTFSPVYVAHDAGLLASEGIKAEITLDNPTSQYIEILSQESPQFIIPTTFATRAFIQGVRPLMVCTIFNQVTHRLVAQPEISDIGQLRGKTLMVNSLGGTSDLEARHVMQSVGFDPKQVSFVEAGPGLEVAQVHALRKREVDAIASSSPFWLICEREGYNVLGDSVGVCGNWTANGLFGNKAFLQREPDLVKALQNAFKKAFDLVKSEPAEVTAIIRTNIPDLEEDIARTVVDRVGTGWDPTLDLPALERFVTLFCAANGLGSVNASEMLPA
jgi:ABC-type nitrate/sulfonate/bicarbonate transport system substrate-binding protein